MLTFFMTPSSKRFFLTPSRYVGHFCSYKFNIISEQGKISNVLKILEHFAKSELCWFSFCSKSADNFLKSKYHKFVSYLKEFDFTDKADKGGSGISLIGVPEGVKYKDSEWRSPSCCIRI